MLTSNVTKLDSSSRSLSSYLVPHNCCLWSISRESFFGLCQYALQHWRCEMYLVWHPNGYSDSYCILHLPSNWQRKWNDYRIVGTREACAKDGMVDFDDHFGHTSRPPVNGFRCQAHWRRMDILDICHHQLLPVPVVYCNRR